MNRETISSNQFTCLAFTFIIATATLFLPSFVTNTALQDGWISVLIGSLAGFIIALILVSLNKLYPNATLIEYSEFILGSWGRNIIGIILILFYMHLTSIIVREVSETIVSNILPRSSIDGITIILIIISAYAVKKGLEVISRLNILILIITFLAMFTCLALLIKDMNIEFLTPVLSKGIMPILVDSLPVAGWFAEIMSIAFILPFLNKSGEAKASSMNALIWASLTLSILVTINIMTFGPKLSGNLLFPTLEAVRIINISDYIERPEIIFLIPWILANIIKISFFYYITVFTISNLLKLNKKNFLVFPVGIIIFSLSLSLFANKIELIQFLHKSWGIYSLSIQFSIPFLLWSIVLFRKRRTA